MPRKRRQERVAIRKAHQYGGAVVGPHGAAALRGGVVFHLLAWEARLALTCGLHILARHNLNAGVKSIFRKAWEIEQDAKLFGERG